MKIAVLVYGRLESCQKLCGNIIEAIGGNEHELDFFMSSDNSPQEHLDWFLELYKPVLWTNAAIKYNCDFSKYSGKRAETNFHNMTCHFINKNRVIGLLETHLKQTDIKYDCVVSIRVDLFFRGKLNYDGIEENTVYIPKTGDWVGGINDQLAYGTFQTMRKYMDIFNTSIKLLEKQVVIPHPENLNRANIEYYKLNVSRFEIEYYILR